MSTQASLTLPCLPMKRLPRLSMTGPHVGKIIGGSKTTTLRRDRYKAGWYRLYIGGKEPSIETQLVPVRFPLFYLMNGFDPEDCEDQVPDSPFYLNEVCDAGVKRLVREEGYLSFEMFELAVRMIRGGCDFLNSTEPYYLHRIVEWRNAA